METKQLPYTYGEIADELKKMGVKITPQAVGDHMRGKTQSRYANEILRARKRVLDAKAALMLLEADTLRHETEMLKQEALDLLTVSSNLATQQ